MDLQEVKSAAENAAKAWAEAKPMLEGIKADQNTIKGKLDAFDQGKLDKMTADIASGIEASQKAAAAVKALEEAKATHAKDLEAQQKELAELKTAFNRAPAAGTTEEKSKELAALRKKAFNEFARSDGDRQKFSDYLAKRADAEPELKALSVGTDPNGGYLVMPDQGGIIQTRVFESSPVRQLATVTSIGSDSVEFVLDNDEAVAGWTHETGSRSETGTPTLGKLAVVAEELYAKPKATQKMLDDASIDIEAWLMGKVADIFARKEATAFVSGTGVGQPRGLLSYASGTTISDSQIEQVNSGSASTFTYDGLIRLQNALKEAYQPNASFLFRRASLIDLLVLKDLEGRPIFNLDYTRNGGTPPASLLGSPVYFAADVPAVASSALAMIYGDIRAAYQIVDRRGMSVLRDPYSSKPYVEFYTTKRVGGGVKNFEAVKLGKISS